MRGKRNHKSMGHSMPVDFLENKALKISAWITGIYFLIELGIAVYSKSIAVLSDAFHTFSAVGGVLLAIIAKQISIKPADKYKSFGRFRTEIVGALINGLFLFGMAGIVIYMGWMRLKNPISLPTMPMFVAATGGLITEVISIKLLYSHQKTNLNIKGAFWHILQTFVGSLIIIVAAIVIKFTGFFAIDPILGMLFGLVLFYASYGIIRDSLNILLESVPKEIDLDKVQKDIEKISGVKNVHHIHAWTLTSNKNIFSSHVIIKNMKESEEILKKIKKILNEKYKFYFSTIQIEEKCLDDKKSEHIDITNKVKGGKHGKNKT
jgi:cobalt-zinc-cadmium efflux system protein